MGYWKNISPSGAVKDFLQVWTGNPYRWRVLGLSVLATGSLMAIIIPKSERIPPEKPRITYISTFADGRSDAEIRAANVESQKEQDKLAVENAKREEARKELYRQLGRATGIDVDKMEREIRASEAAEEAAKAKAARPPVASQ